MASGNDKSRGIGAPWKFDGLEEVDEKLAEMFKVAAGRFSSDGQEFGRPILEKGGDLLNRGHSGNMCRNALGSSGLPRLEAGWAVTGRRRFATFLSGRLSLIIKHV